MTKIKQIAIGFPLTILLLIACIWGINSLSAPTRNEISTEREILADNPRELAGVSDLIVVAKVLPGKENVLNKSADDDFIISGYTLTELEVTNVLQGKVDSDTLKITEEYYTTTNIDGSRDLWTQGDYIPASEGDEYLFFLKKYDENSKYDGLYFPVDLEHGKYVTNPTNGLVPNSLEVYQSDNFEKYTSWYDEVYDMYIADITQ